MVYVKFVTTDSKNELIPAIGSDSVFILDGRNTKLDMIFDGIARLNRLKNVHPEYTGFHLIKARNLRDEGQKIGGWYGK